MTNSFLPKHHQTHPEIREALDLQYQLLPVVAIGGTSPQSPPTTRPAATVGGPFLGLWFLLGAAGLITTLYLLWSNPAGARAEIRELQLSLKEQQVLINSQADTLDEVKGAVCR